MKKNIKTIVQIGGLLAVLVLVLAVSVGIGCWQSRLSKLGAYLFAGFSFGPSVLLSGCAGNCGLMRANRKERVVSMAAILLGAIVFAVAASAVIEKSIERGLVITCCGLIFSPIMLLFGWGGPPVILFLLALVVLWIVAGIMCVASPSKKLAVIYVILSGVWASAMSYFGLVIEDA